MRFLKIIGWVFVPYIMLPVQWKKLGGVAKGFGSVWALLALISVIANAGSDKPKETAAPAATQQAPATQQETKPVETPAPQPVSAKPLTIEEKIKQVIIDSANEKTNMDKDRISSLEVNDHMGTQKDGDKIVIAKLNADENLTNNLTRGGILMDSTDVLKSLFAIPEVQEVALFWQFPLVDAYGNTSDGTVLKINLTRETASKINWNNFDNDNYEKIAEDYWEHQGFSE